MNGNFSPQKGNPYQIQSFPRGKVHFVERVVSTPAEQEEGIFVTHQGSQSLHITLFRPSSCSDKAYCLSCWSTVILSRASDMVLPQQPTKPRPRQQVSNMTLLQSLLGILLGISVLVHVSNYRNDASQSQKLTAKNMTTSQTTKAKNEIASDFQLAFRESLGFFDDIRTEQWLRLKEISRGRIHHAQGYRGTPPEVTFYQMNWDPDFTCLYENSIGQASADGHKWVCDPHRLVQKQNDCLVYSFGSNGNFHFEADLLRVAPNCEIHVFDPTNYTQKMKDWGLNSSVYQVWGLQGSYATDRTKTRTEYSDKMDKELSGLNFKTLPETMKELGHVGRRIDVFKIDCEGCEWSLYKDLLNVDLRQVLIEAHSVSQLTHEFFDDMHNEGYVIFHKEPNIQWSGGKCTEFSFLKLAKEFSQ